MNTQDTDLDTIRDFIVMASDWEIQQEMALDALHRIRSRPHTSTPAPISDNTIEQQIAAWEKVLINYHPKEAAASHLKERIRGLKEALSLLSKHDTATAAKAREDMLKEPRDCATCNNNKNAPRVKK